MNEEATTTAATEERGRHCFVRHPDAGGQCWEPGTGPEVYGLNFCEAHGEEARIGAGLESCHDAENFFHRLRNPEATALPSAVRRGLEAAIRSVHSERPADEDHYRALSRAYPASTIPAEVRARVEAWLLDEEPGYLSMLDSLLDSLLLLHKLMRVAHEDRADCATSLIEVLEQERQCLAAQAAYVLRTPNPPEETDEEPEAD